jgi:D-glycero-D-manno-heptose 1,7-bisphosphate phosphatase
MNLDKVGLFLDRDGTINSEVDFLRSPSEVSLLPGVARTIKEANDTGLRVIVITNQSGIARGYLTERDLDAIHDRLRSLLAHEGARIDAIYACPHHPTAGIDPYRTPCDCRKPKPGMIVRGRDEFGLDLRRSFVVGDRCIDMEAGHAAGCTTCLVRTGYGETERLDCGDRPWVDHIAGDLASAWAFIRRQLGIHHA